jgi:toxin FitB
MNIVDSCGWLEYFADSSNSDFFAPAIEDTNNLLVPSITILEVFKRIYR